MTKLPKPAKLSKPSRYAKNKSAFPNTRKGAFAAKKQNIAYFIAMLRRPSLSGWYSNNNKR